MRRTKYNSKKNGKKVRQEEDALIDEKNKENLKNAQENRKDSMEQKSGS